MRSNVRDIQIRLISLLLIQGRHQDAYDFIMFHVRYASASKERQKYVPPSNPVVHEDVFDLKYNWVRFENMFVDWNSDMASNGMIFDVAEKEDDLKIYDLFLFNKPLMLTLVILFVLSVNYSYQIMLNMTRFNVFILGTIPATSNNPDLLKLNGNYPVISKIFEYTVSIDVSDRIKHFKLYSVLDQWKTFALGMIKKASNNQGLVEIAKHKKIVQLLQSYVQPSETTKGGKSLISGKYERLIANQLQLFAAMKKFNFYLPNVLHMDHPIVPIRRLKPKFFQWEKPRCITGELVCVLRFLDMIGETGYLAMNTIDRLIYDCSGPMSDYDTAIRYCWMKQMTVDVVSFINAYHGVFETGPFVVEEMSKEIVGDYAMRV